MSDVKGLQLLSTLGEDGLLTVELVEQTVSAPKGREVLIRMEAAPINPSDLGLLFGPADVENAEYSEGRLVARMPEGAVRAMKARIGEAMPVGNEGAGTVIAAGDAPEAQALLNRRVTCLPGGAYAQYRLVDAGACIALPDHVTAEQGASAFVNPLTSLGFTETMKLEGFTGLVHTAAASNLGQMLVKICQEDGIPLVNIVRSAAQEKILRDLGAQYVLDSTAPDFLPKLIDAIAETGAMLGFDAIGGGTLAGQILTAMEAAASRGAAYSRYGSSTPKKVYIYGALDLGPTVLNRAFGLTWDLAGWLLTPFMAKAGPEIVGRMRARVMDNITTTFASHYKARVPLKDILSREAVLEYNARRTGEKYLILPNG